MQAKDARTAIAHFIVTTLSSVHCSLQNTSSHSTAGVKLIEHLSNIFKK
jgi:hypothetical protein